MQQVVDAQTTFDWAIWLPNVPGSSYDTRDFTFRCTGTSLPAVTQESFKVEAHGLQFNYPGRRTWAMEQDVTMFETRDAVTRTMIEAWLDFCRNIRDNSGNYKADYAVDAIINTYDAPGNITATVKMVNFFPLELGQATLDNTSALLTYGCKFSYDRTEPVDG
jgi:hypothetical protein